MGRILVVDDEPSVGEILRLYLEREGFEVTVVYDGEAAVEAVKRHSFDLVLLDLMLPKKDGWTVCREIRSFSTIPIIMLTARGEEVDRILGLELGADDYVPKPFSPREVVARVKAVLRRGKPQDSVRHQVIRLGPLVIDHEARKVLVQGTPISTTPKEFELLYFLALHPNRVFSREKLLEEVWGYDFLGDTRTVDTHIKRLREKLEAAGAPPLIKTVWGYGYRLEFEGP